MEVLEINRMSKKVSLPRLPTHTLAHTRTLTHAHTKSNFEASCQALAHARLEQELDKAQTSTYQTWAFRSYRRKIFVSGSYTPFEAASTMNNAKGTAVCGWVRVSVCVASCACSTYVAKAITNWRKPACH